jgi:hypothetical protein
LPNYGYSSAMKGADFVWDKDKLDSFIAKPDEVVPGNNMKPYGGLASAEDRSKLIAFLQSPGTNPSSSRTRTRPAVKRMAEADGQTEVATTTIQRQWFFALSSRWRRALAFSRASRRLDRSETGSCAYQ